VDDGRWFTINSVQYNFYTMKTRIGEGHFEFNLRRVNPYRWEYLCTGDGKFEFEGKHRSAALEDAYQGWLVDKAIEEVVLCD